MIPRRSGRRRVQAPAEEHVLQPTQTGGEAFGSWFSVTFAAQPPSEFRHHPICFPQGQVRGWL